MEKGNKIELDKYLWQPKSKKIEYLPITYESLNKLVKPSEENYKLVVREIHPKGVFALVIFDLQWNRNKNHYSPILINLKAKKITGILLPFNELTPFISRNDNTTMGELSSIWISFILSNGLLPGTQ